jgi:methionine-rich copper-binding protein CopC
MSRGSERRTSESATGRAVMQRPVFVGVGYAALVILAVVVGWAAAPEGRRLTLEGAEPGASSVLDASPSRVVLDFDGEVRPVLARVTVYDAEARPVSEPPLSIGADASTLEAVLPPLGAGLHVVTWHVIDGSGVVSSGSYTWQIGTGEDASDRATGVTEVLEALARVATVDRVARTVDWSFAAARVLALLGVLGLVASVFVVVCRVKTRFVDPRTVLAAGSWAVFGTFVAGALRTGRSLEVLTFGDAVRSGRWLAGFATVQGVVTLVALLAIVALVVALVIALVGRSGDTRFARERSVSSDIALVVLSCVVIATLFTAGTGATSRVAVPAPFSATLVDGAQLLTVSVVPPAVGLAELHLSLASPAGSLAPARGATAELIAPDGTTSAVELAVAGSNHWSTLVQIGSVGLWRVGVEIESASSSDQDAGAGVRRYVVEVPVSG